MAELPVATSNFSDPILNRFFLTPQEKADKEKGKALVRAIYQQQINNDVSLNFFKGRNARWIELLRWAKGSQDIKEFLDYMNVSDANKAYVNIDMTQSRIATQFVSTLVESMSKNSIYPCVKAIDDGSTTEKEDRLYEALFRMSQVEKIKQLQEASGIQLEPSNVYVPDDEMSAKVYFQLEDRLPKEIKFEEMLEFVMNNIKFERVANRRTIRDITVLNCGVTKIERAESGKYTVRVCVPTNTIYNFFLNDSGECEITEIGEFYNLKVKDFRSKYGKTPERPDGLTEKEIFNLAKISTDKNIGTFNYMWNDNWALTTYNQNRPYDDKSILVFDCEIDFGEDVYAVSKKDSFGKENIQIKKNVPYQQKTKDGKVIEQPKPDDVSIIKGQKNTKMRGVYCPYGDVMLYWGMPDIIITPYTDFSKSLSAYSINIPFNDGEYVPSLFERAIEPLREYQLVKLKRKQLIAKIKPTGIRIDVESARNLDLGNGDSIAWEEVVRIYDQTGNELWSSKGVDPLQKEAPPLSNTVRNEAITDIVGLTNILLGIVNEIRGLLGVPVYRDGADVGDRTAAKLASGQNEASFNVTDFVSNANNQLWEETFYKLCLLHWNDIVKSQPESKADMIDTRFDVSIKMKITDYEKQLLEADIQRYSQVIDKNGNPAISPKDAIMLRNIDDYKLACWYLATTVEKNRQQSIQDSSRAVQENAAAQQQSLQQNAQNQQQLQQEKLEAEKDLLTFKYSQEKQLAAVNGIFMILSKGVTIPDEMQPILKNLVPNLTIPIVQENNDMVAEEKQKQAQEMAHQYAMSQMQNNGQGQPQNPQEEQAEQGAQQNTQEEQQEQPQLQQQ